MKRMCHLLYDVWLIVVTVCLASLIAGSAPVACTVICCSLFSLFAVIVDSSGSLEPRGSVKVL
jgi:LytS/YehU family sensor histidine kinase